MVGVIDSNTPLTVTINMSATEADTTETDAMNDLTGFQRDLLFTIAGFEKPSGQQVLDSVEGYYVSEITHGRLYPNLDTLVNKGLVEKGEHDRRTNFYSISEEGEEALKERRAWEAQFVGE